MRVGPLGLEADPAWPDDIAIDQSTGGLISAGGSVDWSFEVEDYAGRRVRLEHRNWEKHRPRHPEVVPHHGSIPLALAEPHLVLDLGDQRHYYRFGVGTGKLRGTALRVVVGVDNGVIRTVHFARRVDFSRGVVELDRLDQVDG